MVNPLERTVSSYLRKQFELIDEHVSVADAVKIIQSKHVETIIVTSNNVPVGIATDSDILDKVVIKGEDSDLVNLKSIMTTPILSLSSKSTVKQAIELMRINKIKRIPITDYDNSTNIIGIVTQQFLAEVIRNSVIETTFRSYRVSIRQNYKPILGNLGFIMQFAGILMLVPAILATFLNEFESVAGIYLAVVSMFLTGFIFTSFGEKNPLNLKQSSIVVVSSFVLLSLFGSFPYIYVNPFSDTIDPISLFINSFLESSSGFTTTGISMISEPEKLPESFSFYRSYTLLIGGLSFVYLIMALYYPETKLAAMRDILGGGLLRFRQLLTTISVIFGAYISLLILLLLFLGNVGLFDSVSLSLATLTTGGFVPNSGLLNIDNSNIIILLILGMIIAILPFAFHYGIFSGEIKARKHGKEIMIYLTFLAISITIFILSESSLETTNNLLTSVFHVISASTTTGLQFSDLSDLSTSGKIILIILMLVGGTAFSTSGGIKIARLILVFQKILKRPGYKENDSFLSISSTPIQFKRHKNISSTETNSDVLSDQIVQKQKNIYNNFSKQMNLFSEKAFRESIVVILLFIIFSFITATIITYSSSNSFIDSLFESVSAISNTGLSIGITNIDLDLVSKISLIFNMIFGRFEIIAIIYIFIWRLRR